MVGLTTKKGNEGERGAPASRRTKPDSEYGITRNVRRKAAACWEVSLKRQGRRFTRAFYDGVYGGSEPALAMAREYRDALMAAFSPRTNIDVARRNPGESGAAAGVNEIRNAKGELTGYKATVSTRGEVRYKTFLLRDYSAGEAKARAESQRETWLAEKILSFMVQDPEALRQAMERFPGHLTGQETTALDEETIDETLARIDAAFDARRPRIFAVRVRHYSRNRLVLYVTDGGSPVLVEQMSTSYTASSRADALARLKVRSGVYLKKFFGAARSERFLREHGAAFEDHHFDPKTGIEIHEPV